MTFKNDLVLYPDGRRRRLLGMGGLALGLGLLPPGISARDRLPVVATFSILGDMVREVGGERISLTTIVGPNMDTHQFEPTPQDAKALLEAKVLVLNGLDFEPWISRLVQASEFKGRQVLAADGITVRRPGASAKGGHSGHSDAKGHAHGHDSVHGHAHEGGDPHAWHDLANGMIYVRNIAAGLSKADPRNASYYESRAASYISRMKTLDHEIRTAMAAIPAERRRVISSHDSFGYFGAAYGIEFIPLTGLSSEAEPSARDMARIIETTRSAKVSGIFIENMGSPALAQQVARETGVLMGGTLYSDSLSPPDQPAATYLGMLSWNAGRLVYVLKQSAGQGS